MVSKNFLCSIFILSYFVSVLDLHTEARYLPTRTLGDRLDKLRELLKELLESEIEKEESSDALRWHPDNKLIYKRDISTDNFQK